MLGSLLFASLSTTAAAQAKVWVVDPFGGQGSFKTIQTAVDAASDGDVIVLKGGTYGSCFAPSSFTIDDKSLVITNEIGETVTIVGTYTVKNLAPSRQVLVRGVDVVIPLSTTPSAQSQPVSITDNAGGVWIEASTIRSATFGIGTNPSHGVVVDDSSGVAFLRCTLKAAAAPAPCDGLRSTASDVALYDTVCEGGKTLTGNSVDGGNGAVVTDGRLFASGCTFRGGKGAFGIYGPLSTPFGNFDVCNNGGDGGNGLVLAGAQPIADVVASTFIAGAAGAAVPPCTAGSAGQGTVVPAGTLNMLAGYACSFSATSPIAGGGSTTLTFTAKPGDFAYVCYSATPDDVPFLMLNGVLLLGGPIEGLAFGTIPESGVLQATPFIGAPPPSLAGCVVYLQPVFALSGGGAALGGGSALVQR